jgi:hypothetical protein
MAVVSGMRPRFPGLPSLLRGLALCAAVVLAASCGGVGPSDNVNQDFSGRLEFNTSAVHQFSVGENGEMTVTVTALSNPNILLILYVGQIVGSNCAPIAGYVSQAAALNRQAISNYITRGSYCLEVIHPGTFPEDVDYTVRVSHP